MSSQLKLSPEIQDKIPFPESKIENLYWVGSHLWGTATAASDVDLLITVDQYDGPQTIHGSNVDLTILSTQEFQRRVNNQEFIETMVAHSLPAWRLRETKPPKIPKFNPQKWQRAIQYRMERDLAYAQKNEQKGKLTRATKTRFHALVTLQMGLELLKAKQTKQSYPDFTNNGQYKMISWTKEAFEPIYTNLLTEFNQAVQNYR